MTMLCRVVSALQSGEEALVVDESFMEQTILPDVTPGDALRNAPCFAESAEPVEMQFKRRMFNTWA